VGSRREGSCEGGLRGDEQRGRGGMMLWAWIWRYKSVGSWSRKWCSYFMLPMICVPDSFTTLVLKPFYTADESLRCIWRQC
jgi:hypothetical protein